MDVVINANSNLDHEQTTPLQSMGSALLNFLLCMGYKAENPPLADLLRQFYGLTGRWLIVNPIHWQASHNDATIVATGETLQLGEEESQTLFLLFADYFAVDNLIFHYHDAATWLVGADNKPTLYAKPTHNVVNRSLMPELAELDETMYWQKFFTESQMFFASLPNKSAVNGVWFWGGTPLENKKFNVLCDESLFPFVSLAAANTSLYTPDALLKEFQLIVINDINTLGDKHQEELKILPANWYWNDLAYRCKNSNWFTRLWRTLIHAH